MIDWITEHRCIVHPTWRRFLANKIDNVAEPYRSFWQLIIDGSTQPPPEVHIAGNFEARQAVRRGEWSPTVDRALILAGRTWVRSEKPYSFTGRDGPPESLGHVARFRLEIADHDLLWSALSHSDNDEAKNVFSRLADPLTSQLATALELAERAHVFDATLYTHSSIPSIHERPDDRPLRDWTCLVYLVVEAFKCLYEHQPLQAQTLAARWRDLFTVQGFPLFQRLAVFAMADVLSISSSSATDFLLANRATVLWNMDAKPEVNRFILQRANTLSADDQERLSAAVAIGPERDLFPRFNGSNDDFDEIANSLRTERAASLLEAGLPIPDNLRTGARDELDKRRRVGERPPPRLTARWVQPSTADELLDRSPAEICDLLHQGDSWDAGHQLADLLKQNLDLGVRVLQLLAGMQVSGDVWEIGFRTLNELENPAEKQRISQVLLRLATDQPEWINGPGVRPVSRFLASFEEAMEVGQEEAFLEFWDIAFTASDANGETAILGPAEPVEQAINAPSGDLATALLHRLFSRNLQVGSGLPADLVSRFNVLWEGTGQAHRFARVILGSRVLWLHRIDPEWTRQTVLARMVTDTDETLGLWAAMLWPAQWDVELVAALEGGIPIVLRRRDRASEEFCGRFSEWIGTVLLEAPNTLPHATKSSFFVNANSEMLTRVAWVFGNALENAGDRSTTLWEERVRPIMEEFWPADLDKKSIASSRGLLRMSLAARGKFSDAIETLCRKNLIVPGSADGFLLYLEPATEEEHPYDYANHHPEAVLTALDRSADARLAVWNWNYVNGLLDRLVAETDISANDPRIRRLRQIMAQG